MIQTSFLLQFWQVWDKELEDKARDWVSENRKYHNPDTDVGKNKHKFRAVNKFVCIKVLYRNQPHFD